MFEENQNLGHEAVLKVFGVGGGGGNAVDRMIEQGIRGVEFVSLNTDAQVLRQSKAQERVILGSKLTEGLGAGANPEVGRKAALESEQDIKDALAGTDMVFITAGMGGGTGSGAAPVVARFAKELNILSVAIVTKPFSFEGSRRKAVAAEAIEEIKKYVDTLIVIPNDRLLSLSGKNVTYIEAFKMADKVIFEAVQGIAEIITHPGVVNVDFADVKAVIKDSGTAALMGIGVGSGENRAKDAAQKAIRSPLLETSINGAKHAIINIASNAQLTMYEVETVIKEISAGTQTDLNVWWGNQLNPRLNDEIVVTVIATGFPVDGSKPFDDKIDENEFVVDSNEVENADEEFIIQDRPPRHRKGLFSNLGNKKRNKKNEKQDKPDWLSEI